MSRVLILIEQVIKLFNNSTLLNTGIQIIPLIIIVVIIVIVVIIIIFILVIINIQIISCHACFINLLAR